MAKWTRQPQEQEGTYFFSGNFYATTPVVAQLPPEELAAIYNDLQAFVREKGGIDYLQVYLDEQGRKLYLIDQLNREMIESGQYQPDDNHHTLLWAHEY